MRALLNRRVGEHGRFLLLIVLLLASASAPAAPDCRSGRFDGTEPYVLDERLPFNFHMPRGWVANRSGGESVVVTLHGPAITPADRTSAVSLRIEVRHKPVETPGMVEDAMRRSMEVIAQIDYAGEVLKVYRRPWSWSHGARFLVPHDGRKYAVTVSATNERDCTTEVRSLQELLFTTLTPNGNTTFAAR